MKLILFALFVSVLCVPAALAAPVAPGQGQLSGDTVTMNQQFHIDHYNFRVQKVQWVAGDSAFAKSQEGENIDEGKGFLLVTIALKSTNTEADALPIPEIQILYKDGTQSADDNRTPYNASGQEMTGDYQPGQGATVVYYIPNVVKPGGDNPITKIIFQPHNGAENDSGAPKIFRLLNPPVAF